MNRHQVAIELWGRQVFGPAGFTSRKERALRVLEEAVELAQAEGLTEDQSHLQVIETYKRPIGKPEQEAAGVGVTLLAWAVCAGESLSELIGWEIKRIHEPDTMARVRSRQASKNAAVGFHASLQDGGPMEVSKP